MEGMATAIKSKPRINYRVLKMFQSIDRAPLIKIYMTKDVKNWPAKMSAVVAAYSESYYFSASLGSCFGMTSVKVKYFVVSFEASARRWPFSLL